MERSVEDSKTIQREEQALLGPYDSQKKMKVDDCRPVRGWRRGNRQGREQKKNQNINTKFRKRGGNTKSTLQPPQKFTDSHSTTGEK